MKTGVIIVCYNGMSYLAKCLSALQDDPCIHRIIVVDNKSTDNSVGYLKENHPDIITIDLKENIGFGQANNLGLELALAEGCDYFFLLNQDAYCELGCVYNLIKVHSAHNEYGIVAPVQLNGVGDDIDTKYYDYLFLQNRTIGFDLYNKKVKEVYPVEFVNAAAWLISKECLLKVGGFDPIFFHTGEDDDYVQRVKLWGFKVGVAPNIHVKHDRPQISWSAQKTNLGRQKTLDLLGLKNLSSPLNTNLKRLLKKKLYYIAYDLFKGKIGAARMKVVSLYSSYKTLSVIKKSRAISKEEFAFLKHS